MTGQSYKQTLRRNRTEFLDQLRSKYGALPAEAEQMYLRKMTAIQNQTRGNLGELMGEVGMTASGFGTEQDIQRDRMTFDTPQGARRIDVWHAPSKTALEIKSGYTSLSRFVRRQISKDVWLMKTGQIAKVEWRLMQGGSRPLLEKLARVGIAVSLGWPELGSVAERAKAMIAGSKSIMKGELT